MVESLEDSFDNQSYQLEHRIIGNGLFYFRLQQTDYN
ncbi:MAG: hypothetical protein ACJAYJ_002784 [Saprospiraceae bacterium]|jgi:hypothetical protein